MNGFKKNSGTNPKMDPNRKRNAAKNNYSELAAWVILIISLWNLMKKDWTVLKKYRNFKMQRHRKTDKKDSKIVPLGRVTGYLPTHHIKKILQSYSNLPQNLTW